MNKGGKFCGDALAHTDCDEHYEQAEGSEGSPVLEGRAQPNAAIVEHCQKTGQRQSDDDVGQINGPAGNAVELHRIQLGKM